MGVRAITQYRKMQREGLRGSEWPNIYFGSKHKLYKKCATGSSGSARVGSEAWPGSERRRPVGVVGWRPVPSTFDGTGRASEPAPMMTWWPFRQRGSR